MNAELIKVELVGGPLDGLKVDWDANETIKFNKYYGGVARYELEKDRNTAIYISG